MVKDILLPLMSSFSLTYFHRRRDHISPDHPWIYIVEVTAHLSGACIVFYKKRRKPFQNLISN